MHHLALVRLICWVSDHPGQTTLESTAIFSPSQLRKDSFCLKPHLFYFLPLWEAAAAPRQGRGDSGAASLGLGESPEAQRYCNDEASRVLS